MGGHLAGQTEPRWDLQMAGGVERSAVGRTVSYVGRRSRAGIYRWWVEWSAVGRTVRWADGAALRSTDCGQSERRERHGEDS